MSSACIYFFTVSHEFSLTSLVEVVIVVWYIGKDEGAVVIVVTIVVAAAMAVMIAGFTGKETVCSAGTLVAFAASL